MIIFDLDGTLWNTVTETKEATQQINSFHKIKNFDIEAIERGMGLNFEENAKNYFPNIEKDEREKYLKEINHKTVEIIKQNGAKLYDNVREIIKELSKYYKLGIVTNNTNDYVEAFYKTSNLDRYFVDYIGAATFSISKSDAIKKIVARNNEINNLYVGDTRKDMLAAKEANVEFIHAKYGFDKNVNCKYYVNDITELPKLVSDISII